MANLLFTPDKIEQVPLASLKPYPANPRLHSDEHVALIAKSIEAFGWLVPVLVDDDSNVIAGHGRILAAHKLGITAVPTIRARHLTPEQARAYRITDNQTTLASEWDAGLLSLETIALGELNFDLGLLGFDENTLKGLLNPLKQYDDDELDEEQEPQDDVVSRIGDVWTMGKHRLLCGDSTKADDVAALVVDTAPHLMVTDPPYGVDYEPDWRNRADRANGKPYGDRAIGLVTNDTRSDWSAAYSLATCDVAYVWHPPGARQVEFFLSLLASGFEVRMQIVWSKSSFPIGRGHYHVQHEPCWYAVRKGKTAHWQGDRTQSTIWNIPRPSKSETGHSTQKPIECMRRPIINNSTVGDSVYDPFLGSGTTLIAAETTNRICYGIEIAPQYVDVSVRRWQKLTGKHAVLDGDGRTFAEIEEERKKGTTSNECAPPSASSADSDAILSG